MNRSVFSSKTSSQRSLAENFGRFSRSQTMSSQISSYVGGSQPQNNRNDEESDGENELNSQNFSTPIWLSIYYYDGKLGAAYFESETRLIYLLEDVVESTDTFSMFQNCQQNNDSNSDGATSTDGGTSVFSDDKPKLTLIPSKAFGIESCRKVICATFTKNDENDLGENEKRLKTSFAVNLEAVCMIRSLGVLIKFLNLTRIVDPNEVVRSSTTVNVTEFTVFGIKLLSLHKMVIVDSATFNALQIFQRKFRQSVFKVAQGGSKEGLSLFALCNRCCSGPGTLELKRWFLRPLSDKEVLESRLEAVQFLANDKNVDLVAAIRKSLRRVRYINRILPRMQQLQASVANWITLYRTVYSAVHVGELLGARERKPKLLDDLAKNFNTDLRRISTLMAKIADFDEMKRQNRFIVKSGVDLELDKQKQFYANLPEIMTELVKEEMNHLLFTPTECSMTYVPVIGYLLIVPRDDEDCEKPGVEFLFCLDDHAYYKSPCCHRMDVEFGDVKFKIIDSEKTIMIRFQKVVLDSARSLMDAVNACAQLDCLISFALASREFGWVKPTIVDEEKIDIKKGRHPLMELCTNPFVANSTRSSVSDDEAKVHIITGPNASGKSIYLKQVGILVYLVHVGCFVPAESVVIGLVDRIFTRVHTIDSVLDGMSTFAVDVKQMAVAVSEATRQSLVIVDEFGKGALTEVGLSLLVSSIESWLEKENECPHVFISTHLHALLTSLPKSQLLRFQAMEAVRRKTEFVFLYELVDGFIDFSYAVHIANQIGLPENIISRSDEVCAIVKSGNKILRPRDTEESHLAKYERRETKVIDEFISKNWDNEDCEFPNEWNFKDTDS